MGTTFLVLKYGYCKVYNKSDTSIACLSCAAVSAMHAVDVFPTVPNIEGACRRNERYH